MSKWRLDTQLAAAAVLAAGVLWGCGLDETHTGLGEGALPGDPLWPVDDQCEAVDCGCSPDARTSDADDIDYGQLAVEDLVGVGYRFDSLELTAPLTGVIGDGVNGYFAQNILNGLLNVLLLVSSDDRDSGELAMTVGAGDEAGEGYVFGSETSELLCTLRGRAFETDEPASLSFPADVFDPPELPISFLRLSGVIANDGSAIEGGVLTGALTEEDALEIMVFGSDFAAFMENMDIPMDMDTDGDGTNDAWRFVGSFTAAQVDVGVEQ